MEQSYPTDAKLWVGVSMPTAAVASTLIAVKAPWYVRLGTYITGAAVVRYSLCCRRPEGSAIFVMTGSFFPEFVAFIVRGHP